MTSAECVEQPRATEHEMRDGEQRTARRAITARALLLVAALGAMPLAPAHGQADSTSSSVPLFTYRDVGLAGAFALGAYLVRPLDDHYARRLQDSSTQANRKLQTLSVFVRTTAAPGSWIIGTTMYATGRVFKNEHLAELGLHGTEALLIGEAIGVVMKGTFGRQRPFVKPMNPHNYSFLRGFSGGDQYRSFPSGHTLAAFAAAASVSSETARWWPNTRWVIGPAMYGGATLVAVSRMYDNRHWASDVIAGAGIGTFAGLKVVRFNRSNPGNRIDAWLLTGSITPTPDGGHALRWLILPGVGLGRPQMVQVPRLAPLARDDIALR